MAGDYPLPPDDYILVGRVVKSHGLKGEVKITCYSEQPENLAAYKRFYLMNRNGEISRGLSVQKNRIQAKGAIVQLEAIDSREEADEVVGASVLIAKTELPEIASDKFYYYQFHGKRVVDKDGLYIGLVKQIFDNGGQDILVVGTEEDEVYIPVTKTIVIDETDDELVIDPPPGLLELNRQPE